MSCRACEAARSTAKHADTPRSRKGAGATPPRYGMASTDTRGPPAPVLRTNGPMVQRKGNGTANAASVPTNGRPLDSSVRAQFESRMGADFSRVRVHDSAAAGALGARAYTVGTDISFASGQYRPDTAVGRRLIAHELAHVVQQGGQPVAAQAKLRTGTPGDAFEREADQVADVVTAGGSASPGLSAGPMVQMDGGAPSLLDQQLYLKPLNIPPPPMIQPGSIREAWVIPDMPAPPELRIPPLSLGHKPPSLFPPMPQLHLDPSLQRTPVTIVPVPRCNPDRPLTWADFPGSNVPNGFGGVTRMVTPLLNIDGNPMFQAQLDQVNKSAVVSNVRNPTRATNGCAGIVGRCKREIGTGTWTSSRPTPDTCPAGIVSIDTATSVDECETVLGANCDAAARDDSMRLLAHEQLHFDIACTLVGKANDALIAGTHTPAQLRTWLAQNLQPTQDLYDVQAGHSCNPTGQATWIANVAGGLTSVPLPPVTPAAAHP
jgi:hypothetical protein